MPCCKSGPMTLDDKKCLAIGYLIPGAAKVVGGAAYSRFPDGVNWFKFPPYACNSGIGYLVMDAVALSPMGCAAMLAHKAGGGCKNKVVAAGLGVYSVSALLGGAIAPAYLNKALKPAAGLAAASSLTAVIAALLFGQECKRAGWMMMPWALIHLYYAIVLAQAKPPASA